MLSRSIFFSLYIFVYTNPPYISLSFFFTVTVHKRLVFLNKSALNQKHLTVGKKETRFILYYNFFMLNTQYEVIVSTKNDKRKPC